MKLIDLLVQELPKRGGWPDGAEYARVAGFGGEKILVEFLFPAAYNKLRYSIGIIACHLTDAGADVDCHMIRRDSYESALAASKKPAWIGEGPPPAGCEVEYISNGTSWGKVKVIGLDGEKVVIRPSGEIYYAITPSNKDVFIPFRTEAEKKHEAVLESICAVLEMVAQDYKREDEARLIYEAIAAGKIPGVKLEE
ncbi:TPA: hypothetical protein I8N27_003368 [Salmonella enterica subsp. enterica serovar Derby]|nr:hypothetical protein [Salmonella enterica subsp. enterica serovar Derby]HAS9766246.1 hypothetical protein [Salmonella enterica subsp. enterica serovar Derby]